jgi:hypothetical protein
MTGLSDHAADGIVNRMPKLSIFIPSHEVHDASSQTLLNAFGLSRHAEIEAVISDNSGDRAKHSAWTPLCDESFRYMVSQHSGASQNALSAFEHTKGEWCCFLSDDDQLIALPGFDAQSLSAPSTVVGICPTMALYTQEAGIYRISTMKLTQARAIERVRHYLENHGGANTTLFSCYRRSVFAEVQQSISLHPTRGGYNDWAIVLALISSGQMLSHEKLLYVYNNRNWSTNADISRNTRRTFTDVGMAEDNDQILNAHLALDALSFICRATSQTEIQERLEAGEFAFNRFFLSFCNVMLAEGASSRFDPKRLSQCRTLAGWAQNTPERVAALLVIIDTWNPGLADRYIKFINETVAPPIAEFLLMAVNKTPAHS